MTFHYRLCTLWKALSEVDVSMLQYAQYNQPIHEALNSIEDTSATLKSGASFRIEDTGLLEIYLEEIWLGEFPETKSFDTVQAIEQLQCDKQQEFVNATMSQLQCNEAKAEKLWIKLQNLSSTVSSLFKSNSTLTSDLSQFLSLDFVCQLHRRLMVNLHDSPGTLRSIQVRAANTCVVYARFDKVLPWLEALLKFVCEKEEEVRGSLVKTTKLAALFFAEFLLIHPFSNGNGRVARVLLSLTLRPVTITPVSLYFRAKDGRESYLQALMNSQDKLGKHPPVPIFCYLVACMAKTCADTCYLALE
jgi:fido (protein-threonine AMPylation protein)